MRSFFRFAESNLDDKSSSQLNELHSEQLLITVNLEDACLQFDDGQSFLGSFEPSVLALSAQAAVDNSSVVTPGSIENVVRRHIHLLMQLCLFNINLLESLFNLYGCAVFSAGQRDPCDYLLLGQMQNGNTPRSIDVVSRVLEMELRNMLPSLIASFSPTTILSTVMRSDPLGRRLFQSTLESIQSNMDVPASPGTVGLTELYSAFNILYRQFVHMGNEDVRPELRIPIDPEEVQCNNFARLELLVPVVTGVPPLEFADIFPSLLQFTLKQSRAASSGDSAVVNFTPVSTLLCRVVRCRPPLLTKSALLVALHKYVS